MSNNGKITICVSNDLNFDQRMERIAKYLVSQGHQVRMVGRGKGNSTPLEAKVYEQLRLECYFERGWLFYAVFNIHLFLFLLFGSRQDTILSVDLDTILPCFLAARLRGSELVFDAHELFPEVPELRERPSIRSVWKKIESLTVPHIKKRMTVSASIADHYREKWDGSWTVVRNVPELKVVSRKEKQEKALVYRGVLNEGRGLGILIEYLREFPGELWLLGGGDLELELKSLADQLDVNHRVRFYGMLSLQELDQMTAKAAIGFNLLDENSLSYRFSLANKFFDYINLEVPSVTMQFPEYQSILKEFKVGVAIEDLSLSAIDGAVREIRAHYDAFVNECRRAKQTLNWETECKKLRAIF